MIKLKAVLYIRRLFYTNVNDMQDVAACYSVQSDATCATATSGDPLSRGHKSYIALSGKVIARMHR